MEPGGGESDKKSEKSDTSKESDGVGSFRSSISYEYSSSYTMITVFIWIGNPQQHVVLILTPPPSSFKQGFQTEAVKRSCSNVLFQLIAQIKILNVKPVIKTISYIVPVTVIIHYFFTYFIQAIYIIYIS